MFQMLVIGQLELTSLATWGSLLTLKRNFDSVLYPDYKISIIAC